MDNIPINIDSRFRDINMYPNPAEFIYRPNAPFKNCAYIRLSSIEIPNLYFTFSNFKNNTSFSFTCLSNNYIIKIDEGMYGADLMMDTINNKMVSINNVTESNLNISFDIITGYTTIHNNVPFSVNFSNSPSQYNSLGYQLGFRKNIYNSVYDNHIYYIKSESQLDCVGDAYIFLCINDYGCIHHEFEDIIVNGDIKKRENKNKPLAKIIMYSNKTDVVNDNGSNFLTKQYIFKQPVDIYKFDISLLDPLGNVIDLLYMNFSMTLEIGLINDSVLKNELATKNNNIQLYNILQGQPIINKNMDSIFKSDTDKVIYLNGNTEKKKKKKKINFNY